MRGDGDGWQLCARGERHWGRYGAAGLLVYDGTAVLLQHRAERSHHGGTWGLLGGARDSEESPEHAAVREACEEGGVPADRVRPTARYVDDHGGWSYSTVLARSTGAIEARPAGWESVDVRWVALDEIPQLPLHPGFAASWPLLRRCLHRLVVIVDGANVVGSNPDGWWRDRAGAAARLRDRLAVLAGGVAADAVPTAGRAVPGLTRWFPELVLVVEGAARPVADTPGPAGVRTVAAVSSGDDTVVEAAAARCRESPDDFVIVVTADRELRRRSQAAGAEVAGPSWLAGLLGTG